jgi:hypothetical protein
MKNYSISFLLIPILLFACTNPVDDFKDSLKKEIEHDVDSLLSKTMGELDQALENVLDPQDFEKEGYELLELVQGNLDDDSATEAVAIYDTNTEGELGSVRELIVFKKTNGRWQEWTTSQTAVLESEAGGMMGDPLVAVTIENGLIIIEHFGGSNWKWSYAHKYRFQNSGFYCIGVTTESGAPCENWQTFDYNMSTGDIHFTSYNEECADENPIISDEYEEDFSIILDELPRMSEIKIGENKVKIPKSGTDVYY